MQGTKKKQTWITRRKKGAAGSAMGKAIINNALDDETLNMISAIKQITIRNYSAHEGTEVKKNIYKLAVKLIVLYNDGLIRKEDMVRVRGKFRMVCSSIKNGYRTGTIDEETAGRIEEYICVFVEGVGELLDSLIGEKTLRRIESLKEMLGSKEWVLIASTQDEFMDIIIACDKYLGLT